MKKLLVNGMMDEYGELVGIDVVNVDVEEYEKEVKRYLKERFDNKDKNDYSDYSWNGDLLIIDEDWGNWNFWLLVDKNCRIGIESNGVVVDVVEEKELGEFDKIGDLYFEEVNGIYELDDGRKEEDFDSIEEWRRNSNLYVKVDELRDKDYRNMRDVGMLFDEYES